jgi:hypothetical protein
MLAHIGGVPVEESLLYLAPVLLLVAWMYYAGWRERRAGGTADGGEEEEEKPSEARAPGEQVFARQAPAQDD